MFKPKKRANRAISLRQAIATPYVAEPLERRLLLAGVTLITHGFNDNTAPGSWAFEMAEAIAQEPGINASIWQMTASDNGNDGPISVPAPAPLTSTAPNTVGNPQIIILLDWSEMAGQLIQNPASPFIGYERSTVAVAQAVAAELLQPNIAGVPSLAALPFHLIGHSRGGSLVAQLAEDLGNDDLWVDQVTTLDPHPVGIWNDSTPQHWSNIVFFDNYWQPGDVLLDPLDFVGGQSVSGAYNQELDDSVLGDAGYSGIAREHLDVHLWYQGTIDTITPVAYDGSNYDAGKDGYYGGSDWYDVADDMGPRDATGYYFSQVVGGNRPQVAPEGLSDEFGGTASTVRVTTSGVQWPDIGYVQLIGGTNHNVQIGNSLDLQYHFQTPNSNATVTWYVDTDQNPFNNSNPIRLQTDPAAANTGGFPQLQLADLVSTAAAPAGNYYVYAEIQDGGLYRYAYVPGEFSFTAPPSVIPSVPKISAVSPGTLTAESLGQRQPITITGSGFTAQSTLLFNDGTQNHSSNASYLQVLNSTTIQYQIAVGPNPANWTVQVLNGSAYSNIGSFNVVSGPTITSVTPSSILPLPEPQTQLLTINGSGFTASSTLKFTDTLGNTYANRVPTFLSASELQYNVDVNADVGEWMVQVINPVGSSLAYPFFVANQTAVATPTISPGSGSYSGSVLVALETATSGAAIYYTLDGSMPTTNSSRYYEPFTISSSSTVKAQAFGGDGQPPSAVATASFSINKTQQVLSVPVSKIVLSDLANASAFSVLNSVSGSGTMHYTLSTSDGWISFSNPNGQSSGPNTPDDTPIAFNVTAFPGPGGRVGTITITANGALGSPGTLQVIQGSDPYSSEDIQAGSIYLTSPTDGTLITTPEVGEQVQVNFTDNFVGINNVGITSIGYTVSQNQTKFDSEYQNSIIFPGYATVTDPDGWTIAPGQNTFQVTVDTSDGADEYDLDNNTAALTFTAAPIPQLSVNSLSVVQYSPNVPYANFVVSLSTPSYQSVTVDYATADGTALADTDYVATSGTLTFNPGDTSAIVQVPLLKDTASDSNKTFFLNLSGATNATISQAQGTGTINAPIPQTIYVDANTPVAAAFQDGNSWATAYANLQTALANVFADDTIDVAQGTYLPTDTTDRTATFQLVDGVAIYGGYAGDSTSTPGVRNVAVYPTILSGDIGSIGDDSDNSYHVVTGSGTDSTAVLDGFTITEGNADGVKQSSGGIGGGDQIVGGGMLNVSGNPSVSNCIFENNVAGLSTTGDGGGGGLFNYYSSPTLTDCTFINNTAGYGIYGQGGGVLDAYSSPKLINCQFISNTASDNGGGLDDDGGSSPTLINCTFFDNSSPGQYGAGGGIEFDGDSNAVLINCDFTGNSAKNLGGALDCDYSSSITLINCILWGDKSASGNEIGFYDSTSRAIATFSDIQGGFAGTGNINADPLFVNAAAGNFALQPNSPCINVGSNAAIQATGVTTDLAGNPRIVGLVVDMGAYEVQPIVVAWSGGGDGVNWNNLANWSDNLVPTQNDGVTIPSGTTVQLGSGTFAVASLTLASNATLNLGSGVLEIDFGDAADPIATIQSYIQSGYNNDSWTGTGIISSNAAANPGLNAVGYADGNNDVGTPAVAGQIYIQNTLAGDSNLDGIVNFPDLLVVSQNYGKTGQDWTHGDFNYDGIVNFPDLLVVAQNYGKQLAAGQSAQTPSSFSASAETSSPADAPPPPATFVAPTVVAAAPPTLVVAPAAVVPSPVQTAPIAVETAIATAPAISPVRSLVAKARKHSPMVMQTPPPLVKNRIVKRRREIRFPATAGVSVAAVRNDDVLVGVWNEISPLGNDPLFSRTPLL